jgi:hypothetical protein
MHGARSQTCQSVRWLAVIKLNPGLTAPPAGKLQARLIYRHESFERFSPRQTPDLPLDAARTRCTDVPVETSRGTWVYVCRRLRLEFFRTSTPHGDPVSIETIGSVCLCRAGSEFQMEKPGCTPATTLEGGLYVLPRVALNRAHSKWQTRVPD